MTDKRRIWGIRRASPQSRIGGSLGRSLGATLLGSRVDTGAADPYATTYQRYVRAGASGSGSGDDWTNAYTNIPSTLARDTTYWLAGGSYTPPLLTTAAASGTKLCRVKFATPGLHGADSGWSDAYSTQAVLNGGFNIEYSVSRSFITLDGSKRDSLISGYGVRIPSGSYGDAAGCFAGGGVHNLTLRYCDIGNASPGNSVDGIQGGGNNLLVEHCHLHDNDNKDANHGDGTQWFWGNNVTFRYNVFRHNGQHIYCGENSPDAVTGLKVYYNLFDNTATGSSGSVGWMLNPGGSTDQGGAAGIVCNNTVFVGTDLYFTIYPNQFISDTLTVQNNAFYASSGTEVATCFAHSHNAWANAGAGACTGIPTEAGRISAPDLGFTNAGAGDFSIVSGSVLRNAGTDVSLIAVDYAGSLVDILGNPISSASTPTIGAFEFTP